MNKRMRFCFFTEQIKLLLLRLVGWLELGEEWEALSIFNIERRWWWCEFEFFIPSWNRRYRRVVVVVIVVKRRRCCHLNSTPTYFFISFNYLVLVSLVNWRWRDCLFIHSSQFVHPGVKRVYLFKSLLRIVGCTAALVADVENNFSRSICFSVTRDCLCSNCIHYSWCSIFLHSCSVNEW